MVTIEFCILFVNVVMTRGQLFKTLTEGHRQGFHAGGSGFQLKVKQVASPRSGRSLHTGNWLTLGVIKLIMCHNWMQ